MTVYVIIFIVNCLKIFFYLFGIFKCDKKNNINEKFMKKKIENWNEIQNAGYKNIKPKIPMPLFKKIIIGPNRQWS